MLTASTFPHTIRRFTHSRVHSTLHSKWLRHCAIRGGRSRRAGIAVRPGQVLVTPTLTGDINLDGKVGFFDIVQLLGYKYNTKQAASYTDGDVNYDGVVNFFDIVRLLSANYNTGQRYLGAPEAAALN